MSRHSWKLKSLSPHKRICYKCGLILTEDKRKRSPRTKRRGVLSYVASNGEIYKYWEMPPCRW